MNSQGKVDMVQQGIVTGRSLHDKAVGDFFALGASWLARKIFRVADKRPHPATMKQDLKFS